MKKRLSVLLSIIIVLSICAPLQSVIASEIERKSVSLFSSRIAKLNEKYESDSDSFEKHYNDNTPNATENRLIVKTKNKIKNTDAIDSVYGLDYAVLQYNNKGDMLEEYDDLRDKGYTVESFKSGTISLCHAGMFPDKYDSYLYIDQDKIREDLKKALKDALRITLSHITQKSPDIRTEKATQICYYRECGYTDEQIIDKILTGEYIDFCNNIGSAIKKQESRFRNPRNSAKIACFTESVQSKYMWDRYADGYKGFALEYDLRKCIFKYNSLEMNVNLFPVIYTELRPDVTLDEGNIHTYEYFKQVGDKNWLNFLSSMISVNQLYWYRSYLYKDRKEYEHEHEWRMLYYNLEDENNYASIPDVGCLNAIYYGPDIIPKDKDELHLIAVEKGLKEYDVALDAGSRRYDLRITAIK